jgi:hypothetical protein
MVGYRISRAAKDDMRRIYCRSTKKCPIHFLVEGRQYYL